MGIITSPTEDRRESIPEGLRCICCKEGKLLTEIEREYPDVRYLTTPEFGELIATRQYRDVFSGRVVVLPGAREGAVEAMWNAGPLPVWLLSLIAALVLMVLLAKRKHRSK